MQLDPNIILQAKGIQFDNPMELYGRALNLKQLANQNAVQEAEQQKKQQMNELLQRNTKPDASGKYGVDYEAASQQALQSGNIDAGMALQKQFQQHGLEKMETGTKALKMLLAGSDHTQMADIKKQAMRIGVPNAEKLPDSATPEQYQAIMARTLDIDKQLNLIRDQEKQAYDQQKDQRDYSLRERELGLRHQERKDNLNEKRDLKQQEKEDSLATPYGLAFTKDDAKNLKAADEEKKSFDQKIDEMIALREKNKGGALLNREDVARGKQLSKDALLSYKNMAKLGVLSQSDEAIINAIIPPDPLEYNSPVAAIQGQDPILNNLKKFKGDADADFQNRLKNRIKTPKQEASISKIKVGTIEDGFVFMGGDPADQKNWKPK